MGRLPIGIWIKLAASASCRKWRAIKPSAADVQDFQLALQQEVAKLGY
ncbi:MAG: hypothetical protein WDN00_10540 [Limisphaerales bacterium]